MSSRNDRSTGIHCSFGCQYKTYTRCSQPMILHGNRRETHEPLTGEIWAVYSFWGWVSQFLLGVIFWGLCLPVGQLLPVDGARPSSLWAAQGTQGTPWVCWWWWCFFFCFFLEKDKRLGGVGRWENDGRRVRGEYDQTILNDILK